MLGYLPCLVIYFSFFFFMWVLLALLLVHSISLPHRQKTPKLCQTKAGERWRRVRVRGRGRGKGKGWVRSVVVSAYCLPCFGLTFFTFIVGGTTYPTKRHFCVCNTSVCTYTTNLLGSYSGLSCKFIFIFYF